MPYEIKKSGEGYKVFKKGTSKAFSKEPMSHKKAEAQLKALYANANEGKMNTMKKSELRQMIQEIIKEVISEQATNKITEAYVPDNIKSFAKRKGVSSLVNTVASWAEKAGKRITGGTAIGKNYSTLILDMGYQTADIYIDTEEGTIELYGEPVRNFNEFKKVWIDKMTADEMEKDANQFRRESGLDESTDYMKRHEADKKANEAELVKAKDLGRSEKGYYKVKFPEGTREEALKSIEALLKSDQAKYLSLKVDIMPLKKEEDKDFAVIKLSGEGAHTVGRNMKTAYKEKAGFKGAIIKPYHPTFQSK
jgi:hypothetical protein